MIYLDNAATTRPAPEVLEAMLPYCREQYGNPSAGYLFGAGVRKALEKARRSVAACIGAGEDEIVFTSGGTESDNWALAGAVMKGIADRALSGQAVPKPCRGGHIITSAIEHHAVLHTCRYLERMGVGVTYLPVDEKGFVRLGQLEAAIRPDTALISIMTANNEIGTIEPIREIGALARERGILFHTDAVQAFGQIPLNVEELGVDLLSASAHKLHGPKGVGLFYVRRGLEIEPFHRGGGQERGRRAGTENVPGIVGFGAAAELALRTMEERSEKVRRLRDHLMSRLEREIPYCRVNGDREKRLPGNVHVTIPFVEGETLLIQLDMKGICVSSGSACAAGSGEPSHVLTALGQSADEARGSLRLTLSAENTREEIDRAADEIQKTVAFLRGMSPDYEAFRRRG